MFNWQTWLEEMELDGWNYLIQKTHTGKVMVFLSSVCSLPITEYGKTIEEAVRNCNDEYQKRLWKEIENDGS
jgi:hypothetical protein